jgi:allantoicase
VVEIDTTHYKGNAPDQVSVSGIDARHALDDEQAWHTVLPRTRLQPDTSHRFRVTVAEPVTHLRLDVFPDGGIARFRVYGEVTPEGSTRLLDNWRTSLPVSHARQAGW